jgi:tellurite resistance protein TerC
MLLATKSSTGVPGADITVEPIAWVLFLGLIVGLLLVDLLVLNREAHEISTREAAISSAVWISLGVSFTFVIWFWLGGAAAGQYITGYIIEESLSVDNVFVWAVILSYFAVPRALQHRVLFWGIFGALMLRAAAIFGGIALLKTFDWIFYVFGAFLIFTAIRVATHDNNEIDPEHNPVLKLMRRRVPITPEYHGTRFVIRENARRYATPLLVVLVMVEVSDIAFAVDSIPAILAVTRSQFIVFSSNAFAILGLRALYFLLAGATRELRYLNKGLGVILGFVGVKMLLSNVVHIPIWASLLFIGLVLATTVVVSLRAQKAGEDTGQADQTVP